MHKNRCSAPRIRKGANFRLYYPQRTSTVTDKPETPPVAATADDFAGTEESGSAEEWAPCDRMCASYPRQKCNWLRGFALNGEEALARR